MPFRVPAVWASLYFALQSFIDSADAGVSEQISSVAKADADKSVADADMRETPKMRGRMPHDEPRFGSSTHQKRSCDGGCYDVPVVKYRQQPMPGGRAPADPRMPPPPRPKTLASKLPPPTRSR